MKTGIVIATCRQESINRWLGEWAAEFWDAPVYMIEDNPVAEFTFPGDTQRFQHYAWNDIHDDLGEKSWIIPRRSSAIKSYGFYRAYKDGLDAVWTLDDDCYPEARWKGSYLMSIGQFLQTEIPQRSWWNTLPSDTVYPRGFAYGIRHVTEPVKIHHGLWTGVPDLDGVTAIERPDFELKSPDEAEPVPRGAFSMCGMNLAFRRDMIPVMYFGLQGSMVDNLLDVHSGSWKKGKVEALPFDRFDDIWAGLFAKKICDDFGWAVTSGAPSINHTRESDPVQRILKEAPGIAMNELLWQRVAETSVADCATVTEAYRKLADEAVAGMSEDTPLYHGYWETLAHAMRTWTELFDD